MTSLATHVSVFLRERLPLDSAMKTWWGLAA